MIRVKQKGDWRITQKMLNSVNSNRYMDVLNKYGQIGVDALSLATPIDTGKTASSWGYHIEQSGSSYSIVWTNSNVNEGVNIAIILQYGHGTGNGGFVQGRDYINPALQPVFDEIADKVWKEVTR